MDMLIKNDILYANQSNGKSVSSQSKHEYVTLCINKSLILHTCCWISPNFFSAAVFIRCSAASLSATFFSSVDTCQAKAFVFNRECLMCGSTPTTAVTAMQPTSGSDVSEPPKDARPKIRVSENKKFWRF